MLVIGPICLLIGVIDVVVGITGDNYTVPIVGSIFWMLGVFTLLGRSYYLKHKYFELWNNCHQAMESYVKEELNQRYVAQNMVWSFQIRPFVGLTDHQLEKARHRVVPYWDLICTLQVQQQMQQPVTQQVVVVEQAPNVNATYTGGDGAYQPSAPGAPEYTNQ